MSDRRVIIEFPISLLEVADREANKQGVSRSALIRRAVREFLVRRERDKFDIELAEEYRRLTPKCPGGWTEII